MDININIDYFVPDKEFVKIFGNDVELYKTLKPLKEQADVSWKEIADMKWEQVDLENGTISFPVEGGE